LVDPTTVETDHRLDRAGGFLIAAIRIGKTRLTIISSSSRRSGVRGPVSAPSPFAAVVLAAVSASG